MKIGTHGILEALIPNPDFEIATSKSIFGHVWAEKLKVVFSTRQLAQMVPRGCWFLFQHQFSEFPAQNPFFGQIWAKTSKFSVLPENCHSWYLEDPDSYSDISFSEFQNLNPFLCKFRPKNSKFSIFAENWDIEYLEDADSYSDISFLNFQT